MIVLILGLSTAFGVSLHVIDGKPAKPHNYPWMLIIDGCGGSLLRVPSCKKNASNIAITAAHCVHNLPRNLTNDTVWAGKHDLSIIPGEPGEQTRRIVDYKIHPKYIPIENALKYESFFNDIAIVKFDEPIEFSDTIQPIELPNTDFQSKSTGKCVLTGWGVTGVDITSGDIIRNESTILQELDMKIIDGASCSEFFMDAYVDDIMICARREFPASRLTWGTGCQGDSGGPLACKYGDRMVLEGTVVGGSSLCETPTLFTRVSGFSSWIEEQAKLFGVC